MRWGNLSREFWTKQFPSLLYNPLDLMCVRREESDTECRELRVKWSNTKWNRYPSEGHHCTRCNALFASKRHCWDAVSMWLLFLVPFMEGSSVYSIADRVTKSYCKWLTVKGCSLLCVAIAASAQMSFKCLMMCLFQCWHSERQCTYWEECMMFVMSGNALFRAYSSSWWNSNRTQIPACR